jgi:hypothetical protein
MAFDHATPQRTQHKATASRQHPCLEKTKGFLRFVCAFVRTYLLFKAYTLRRRVVA